MWARLGKSIIFVGVVGQLGLLTTVLGGFKSKAEGACLFGGDTGFLSEGVTGSLALWTEVNHSCIKSEVDVSGPGIIGDRGRSDCLGALGNT